MKAKRSAELVAKEEILKLLDENGSLGMKMKIEIKKRVEAEADSLFADFSLSRAFSDESPSATIAQDYPGDLPA